MSALGWALGEYIPVLSSLFLFVIVVCVGVCFLVLSPNDNF